MRLHQKAAGSAALVVALLIMLLAACAAPAPQGVTPDGASTSTRWNGERGAIVSARLWSDGQERSIDDRETLDALLDVVESAVFLLGGDNAPGSQHTAVTLVYRDGAEERVTFPVWVRDGVFYDAGASFVRRFAAFFPVRPEYYTAASAVFENGGMELEIPVEYEPLLLIETPQDSESGILFVATEKASREAGVADGRDESEWRDGWLFSIGRVSEAETDERMRSDRSGAEVFARDADGNDYLYCHPTDARFYRSGECSESDAAQWSALDEWARNDVCERFLAQNPGLTAAARSS